MSISGMLLLGYWLVTGVIIAWYWCDIDVLTAHDTGAILALHWGGVGNGPGSGNMVV